MERVKNNWAAERPGAITGKAEGGYILIPVRQILTAWKAYQDGQIKFRELRAWWGCQEMLARRCEYDDKEKRLPKYTPAELEQLTGCPARASVRSLEREKLISWSEHSLRFARVAKGDSEALGDLSEKVKNLGRVVPVPRRTVRMLAQVGKPAVMATVIGLLCRCVYYRAGEPVSWGRMKSSWVSDTFDISLRAVKSAMAHLQEISWVIKAPSRAFATKKHGGAYVVNLAWSRPNSYADTPTTSASNASEIAPHSDNEIAPRIEPESSSYGRDLKTSNPERTTGFSKTEGEKKDPTWKHVERVDLSDSSRLLALFESARRAGVVNGSEHERFCFFAAAEHALVDGRNPCALFVSNVKLKRWHHSQGDEDAARQRLTRVLFGSRDEARSFVKKAVPKVRELTRDQVIARNVGIVCEKHSLHPLVVMRKAKLTWSLAELERLQTEAEDIRNEQLSVRYGGQKNEER